MVHELQVTVAGVGLQITPDALANAHAPQPPLGPIPCPDLPLVQHCHNLHPYENPDMPMLLPAPQPPSEDLHGPEQASAGVPILRQAGTSSHAQWMHKLFRAHHRHTSRGENPVHSVNLHQHVHPKEWCTRSVLSLNVYYFS